jgi:hypothetical protein
VKIIIGVFGIIVGFVVAIIYKIIKADKIKVSSIEIDEHDDIKTTTEITKESKIS